MFCLLVPVQLADKVCNKIAIGLTQDQSVVRVTTPKANSLNLLDVDLAKLDITLENSQAPFFIPLHQNEGVVSSACMLTNNHRG